MLSYLRLRGQCPVFEQDIEVFRAIALAEYEVNVKLLLSHYLTTIDKWCFKPNFANFKVISKPTLCLDTLFSKVGISEYYTTYKIGS